MNTVSSERIRLGHVQLRVRDLERSKSFYEGLLGLPEREVGRGVVFLGSGSTHHQIALHAVGQDAAPGPLFGPGLSHIAFEVEDRAALLRMYRTLGNAGVRVSAVDLGVTWSLYLQDPDGNEVEVYCDTRRAPGGRPYWKGQGQTLDLRRAETLLAAEDAATLEMTDRIASSSATG
jgi:catechol 2,3-dioxygenase